MILGILSGILAGYIASRIQKGKGSGCLVNLFLGVVGGAFGGWLFSLLGVGPVSWLGEIFVAVVGALILMWIARKFK
ncbi:MAG: GlsB/YeaQ/YmgE family stress response membrane protein [Bacteroidaceae bacterium]|nr:GlsB/YeaQ/YmgE family stress response membrane protein [Bacteroidaceae bacterium]